MFVRCIAIILIAFGRVWIASISTILKRLDATTKTCMQRMRDIVEHVYARALAKLKQSAIAVLWSVSASIVKGPKNTQSYSLHGYWKGSSQDIKMPKKAIYLEHYKRRYKGLILKVWNSIFLCILSEVYIIASFLLQSLISYQHNINPNLPNDGYLFKTYLGKFLESSKLMFF